MTLRGAPHQNVFACRRSRKSRACGHSICLRTDSCQSPNHCHVLRQFGQLRSGESRMCWPRSLAHFGQQVNSRDIPSSTLFEHFLHTVRVVSSIPAIHSLPSGRRPQTVVPSSFTKCVTTFRLETWETSISLSSRLSRITAECRERKQNSSEVIGSQSTLTRPLPSTRNTCGTLWEVACRLNSECDAGKVFYTDSGMGNLIHSIVDCAARLLSVCE